ncbi:MAG TPA: hypothetical protein VJR22_06250 [Candidatus Nitrosotalea sp.]|nr:hypothetical protein [Nitrososphaerota archaeon]HKU33429.1 hypothetical protein [Candidatus Nitrosotalea sp.]
MAANVLFHQGNSTLDQTRKALVTVAVESVLFAVGDNIHKKISDLLMNLYDCEIVDCYKHPEYLNMALSHLEYDIHLKIIESIRKELGKYSYIKLVSSFLNALEKPKIV